MINTVQDLINELNRLPDKTKGIKCYLDSAECSCEFMSIFEVDDSMSINVYLDLISDD